MFNENQTNQDHTHILDLLTGLLIGGLVGAGTMLLLAPQSGEKTRSQIQVKSFELRDQTTGMFEAAAAKVWLAKKKLTRAGRRKTQELLHQGQELMNEQIENVSEAAKTWKKAVLSS